MSRDPGDPNAAGNHRKNLRLSLETSLRRLCGWEHVSEVRSEATFSRVFEVRTPK